MIKHLKTIVSAILSCLLFVGHLHAQYDYWDELILSPKAKMSILVASPSDEAVYTYYGHAGYRVYDPVQGLDVTFNYGIFNFTDDFLFRFVRGRTDYMVVPQATQDYMSDYLGRGSEVVELDLNLDSLERAHAWHYLRENIREDKRVYRYQFFTDNCATRPLRIVDEVVSGLRYSNERKNNRSWRDEINDLEQSAPWLVLATDLALGVPTDKPMREQERAFSPRLLVEVLREAKRPDGRPILNGVNSFKADDQPPLGKTTSFALLSPVWCFTLLLICVLYVYVYQGLYKSKKIAWAWDLLLFVPMGLGGLVLFYISCLSEHQFVSPNYNLWVIHPLHFLLLPLGLLSRWTDKPLVCYHFANFVGLTVFLLVAYFLPQHFNMALYLVAMTLGLVSLSRIGAYRRAK